MIILFLLKISYCEILKIPFLTLSHNKDNYMKSLYLSNIYSEILLGTPFQKFNSSLKLDISYSYILTNKSQLNIYPLFNTNSSSSYKEIEKKNYYGSEVESGILSKDKINLILTKNKYIEIDNFKFITSEKIYHKKKENIIISSCLGFQLLNSNDNNNIILQLKNKSLIDQTTFTFEFNEKNKNIGNLIIGKKNIGEEFFLNTQTSKIENLIKWSFQFDEIFFGEKKLEKNLFAEIQSEIDLIIAPTDFIRDLWENYFSKKNCSKDKFVLNSVYYYNYYICDINVNINDFLELKFYEKNLNYTFTLNKNDIFEDYERKKYFKIIESHYYINYWVFGRIFLKKYQLYFDYERKTIGIYLNKKKKNSIGIYIIFFFLILVIIILIYLLFKLWKNKRKKRAFELNDDYEYITNN